MTKKHDKVIFDLTGTGPEVDAPINGMKHQLRAVLPMYLCGYVCWDLPPSMELIRPFEVVAPEGSLCNADTEKAQALGASLGFHGHAAIQVLFGKMIFDSEDRKYVVAPWAPNVAVPYWGGADRHGNPVASMGIELNAGGSGARPDMDGVDVAGLFPATISDCLDAEECENRDPILYLFRNKYYRDNMGHGRQRGGASLDVAYGVHKVPFLAMGAMCAGSRFPSPPGIFGGYAGSMFPGLRILDAKVGKAVQEGRPVPTCSEEAFTGRALEGTYINEPGTAPLRMLGEGSFIMVNQGGGGGYGDVLERDPETVVQDVEKHLISEWTAREVYRVVYDPEAFVVDEEATKRLREAEREDRRRRGKAYADFEREWLQKRPPEEALKYYGVWPDAWV